MHEIELLQYVNLHLKNLAQSLRDVGSDVDYNDIRECLHGNGFLTEEQAEALEDL